MGAPLPVIELLGVEKSFGAVDVLKGVDFAVEPGKVTALVGDNGAGKSTLIKGLAGIQPYDKGIVKFDGKEISIDRKSTRLNSSHITISYAVFCL